MRLGRTIVALLVALSVALLPVAGGAAFAAKSADISASEPLHDGCDRGVPDDASKAVNDCASMAACAAKCFNYAGTVLSDGTILAIGPTLHPVGDSGLVVSQIGNPPFRPPRV
jgi:hypothetical protein